jgi:hypothetical protein
MQRLGADHQILERRKRPASSTSNISLVEDISLAIDNTEHEKQQQCRLQAPKANSPWMWIWKSKCKPEVIEEDELRENPTQFEMIATSVSETTTDVLCVRLSNIVLEDEDNDSDSSLSTDVIQKEADPLLHIDVSTTIPTTVFEKRSRFVRFIQQRQQADVREMDLEKYMEQRAMTATQEHWNAVTMIPNPLYCLYFLLSGKWVSPELVKEAQQEMVVPVVLKTGFRVFHRFRRLQGFGGLANVVVGDAHGCLPLESSAWWFPHNMPALPPLPVMAVALGIILHAPFSFWYHWKTPQLPRGSARTTHWTRRMDQSMIHVASALLTYATSGSWDYFFANVLYNTDCIYRQFQTKVRPRRNQIRIGISIVAYTLPIIRRGEFRLFGKLWMVLLTSGWLFGTYPIGGWSHCVFHFVIALLPSLLMNAACELPSAQDQMKLAAQCLVAAQQGNKTTT